MGLESKIKDSLETTDKTPVGVDSNADRVPTDCMKVLKIGDKYAIDYKNLTYLSYSENKKYGLYLQDNSLMGQISKAHQCTNPIVVRIGQS